MGQEEATKDSLRIAGLWPKNKILTIPVKNQKCQLLTCNIIDAIHLSRFHKILLNITQQSVVLLIFEGFTE
jgi:hypothetical protein